VDDQGEIFALDVVIGDYMWVLKGKDYYCGYDYRWGEKGANCCCRYGDWRSMLFGQ
jgi:hypothetical protein